MARENPARERSAAEVVESQRSRGIAPTTSRLLVIMRRVPVSPYAPSARRVWKLTKSSVFIEECARTGDATTAGNEIAESKKLTSWRTVGASNTSVDGSES
eukprot:3809826-Prymnesium_polylepis.1